MAALDDNPYAAPSLAADSPPVTTTVARPLSLWRRVVSTALITFAVVCGLGALSGTVALFVAPANELRRPGDPPFVIFPAIYATFCVLFFVFGFWLRRRKPS